MNKPTDLDLARFMAKVNKRENGCWIWTGAKTKHTTEAGRIFKVSAGYGMFTWDGKLQKSHRLMWMWNHGPIPEGMTVEHECHTRDASCAGGNACQHRACVNPDHLSLLSRKSNVLASNGLSALNARKTHCKYGHEFTPENMIPNKRGVRKCRTCNVELTRKWRAERQ